MINDNTLNDKLIASATRGAAHHIKALFNNC